MIEFEKLGLSKDILKVLEEKGFTEPTEIQEKAIPLALNGKDIIGGSSTGSGKTLVFASPIIDNLKPNHYIQALILTPTRELAEQVATSIRSFAQNKRLKVLAVYGGVNIETQMRKLAHTDVLVATPGRTLDHIKRRTLRLDHVKFLVLDEVDRMFDMGFHKDVEMILKHCPEKRQTMMFSATISADIDYLAKKYTENPVEVSVQPHVDPSKLKQIYYDVSSNKKFSLLVHLLKKEKSALVMVFCSTRRNTDFVAENLRKVGIEAKAIHGGLAQNKRINVLKDFHRGHLGVLVCTDVAARGLDIKGITHVYNYDIPSESNDYIHRIGRTARAGKEGKAISILSSRDYENFSKITNRGSFEIKAEALPLFQIVRISVDSNNKRNTGFSRRPSNNRYGQGNRPRHNSDRPRHGSDRPRRTNNDSRRGSDNRSRGSNKHRFGKKPYSRR